MKKPLVLFGAGGLGREALSLCLALPEWEVKGFYDDGLSVGTDVKSGLKVLGGINQLKAGRDLIHVVLAIGSPEAKLKIYESLKENGNIVFPTLIHPSAILQDSRSIVIGQGCLVGAGTIMTTEIEIGNHVLVNLNCTIGHNVKIGAFSSVMPGVNVAGEVSIGEGVLIGAGANVINRLSIGSRCKVGAGAAVINSIPEGCTAVGVPARVIKTVR